MSWLSLPRASSRSCAGCYTDARTHTYTHTLYTHTHTYTHAHIPLSKKSTPPTNQEFVLQKKKLRERNDMPTKDAEDGQEEQQKREGHGSGGVGWGPHSRRGSGGQGRAAALNAWPEGEARPVASTGVPGLPEPPQRCVWSATSWASASIHNALKWGGAGGFEGSTGGNGSPFTHTHTLACTPRCHGQGSGPMALQLGVWDRERERNRPPAQMHRVRGGSLLASPNPRPHRPHRESPEPPPHSSPKAGL